MIASPSAMASFWGSKEPCSATPTAKPTKSKPPGAKTPGNSDTPVSNSLQPASTQPSDTPFTSCIAWRPSSFSTDKCLWKNSGSAPRAAMSLTQSATKSMPRPSKFPTWLATFNLVPRAFALLITTPVPLPILPISQDLPRKAGNIGSLPASWHVRRMRGSKLFMAASAAALSTPDDLYVNSQVVLLLSSATRAGGAKELFPERSGDTEANAAMSCLYHESVKLIARTAT
mmetsp:Transcript_32772/g.82893  ORF Transcript_32772/g.82893 Transcript_32772/m.82893 type:complete len:230 (-) Transcript_32772:1116-1805(-)